MLAGLISVVIAIILTPFVLSVYFWLVYRPLENAGVGYDVVSFAKRFWLAGVLIFLAGFLWEFRRATAK